MKEQTVTVAYRVASRQMLADDCISGPEENTTLKLDQIEAKSYAGGLVKSFEWNAARACR
jgi:hypothetical protein